MGVNPRFPTYLVSPLQALNYSSQYQSEEAGSEMTIIKKELSEQDTLIVLLKTEIGSYKKYYLTVNTSTPLCICYEGSCRTSTRCCWVKILW